MPTFIFDAVWCFRFSGDACLWVRHAAVSCFREEVPGLEAPALFATPDLGLFEILVILVVGAPLVCCGG